MRSWQLWSAIEAKRDGKRAGKENVSMETKEALHLSGNVNEGIKARLALYPKKIE